MAKNVWHKGMVDGLQMGMAPATEEERKSKESLRKKTEAERSSKNFKAKKEIIIAGIVYEPGTVMAGTDWGKLGSSFIWDNLEVTKKAATPNPGKPYDSRLK